MSWSGCYPSSRNEKITNWRWAEDLSAEGVGMADPSLRVADDSSSTLRGHGSANRRLRWCGFGPRESFPGRRLQIGTWQEISPNYSWHTSFALVTVIQRCGTQSSGISDQALTTSTGRPWMVRTWTNLLWLTKVSSPPWSQPKLRHIWKISGKSLTPGYPTALMMSRKARGDRWQKTWSGQRQPSSQLPRRFTVARLHSGPLRNPWMITTPRKTQQWSGFCQKITLARLQPTLFLQQRTRNFGRTTQLPQCLRQYNSIGSRRVQIHYCSGASIKLQPFR